MRSTIEVKGARENNLQNVHIEIPRDKLVVVTGVSGSGKSSLAFDTVYAEGQRRFMESLSTFARRFVSQLKKPDVDFVNGLSPVISIEQKTVMKNPRSTVGTMTDLYDYLRMLFLPQSGNPIAPSLRKKSRSGPRINSWNKYSRCPKVQKLKSVRLFSKSMMKTIPISLTTFEPKAIAAFESTTKSMICPKNLNSTKTKTTRSKSSSIALSFAKVSTNKLPLP